MNVNSFLAGRLSINRMVEWSQQLNVRYFVDLLSIFGLPLVGLFARRSLRLPFVLLCSISPFFMLTLALLCFAYEVYSFQPVRLCVLHMRCSLRLPFVLLCSNSPFFMLTLALLCSAYEVYSFQSVRLCVLHMRFRFCCLSFLCFVFRVVGGVESPLKSEAFCSSLMHFWSVFGGSIFQVINANCFLPCNLPINHWVEWRHHLNMRCLDSNAFDFVFFIQALCVSDKRRWCTPKGSIDVSASKGSIVAQRTSII
ncbi:hypothetical protein JHK85_043674 [Glycine max]|nr:hypothetical protein JHK85_043674 [Glycine max]